MRWISRKPWLLGTVLPLLSGCDALDLVPRLHAHETPAHEHAPAAASVAPEPASEEPPSPTPAASVALPPPASAASTSPAPAPEAAGPCPVDMAHVRGNFCRHVEQRCLEQSQNAAGEPDASRCARFERPSKCISTAPAPRSMSFCMDRYEYPNRPGELPLTLVDWQEAQTLCEAGGKRLCTESEFNFACEGEEMRPYATGFERDANKCNIDQPFRERRLEFKRDAECRLDPQCTRERARLDQREPSGSRPECVSPFGVFDLNGNVNEWVSMPWKEPPHRSAIKGGWWGPVRNRCRPIVTSHDESYVGYEVGFRCCRDLGPG